MKQILFIGVLFVCLFSDSAFSQSSNDTALQRQSYLFEDFITGTVLSKSSEVNQAALNYCSYDQSILFKKEDKIFTLIDLATIDTVYIQQRKFIPFKNLFYEVIGNTGNVVLFVSYTAKMRQVVATSDHNGTSKQSVNEVSNTVSDVYINRKYKGDFSVQVVKHYWLKSFNELHKANNVKDILKVFKESSHSAITDYIKRSQIDFRNETDMIKLVDFCNKQ